MRQAGQEAVVRKEACKTRIRLEVLEEETNRRVHTPIRRLVVHPGNLGRVLENRMVADQTEDSRFGFQDNCSTWLCFSAL